MVVVVPSFAKGEKGDPQIVSALVIGFIALSSEEMGERVHRKGAVVEEYCGNQESPDESGHAIQSRRGLKKTERAEAVTRGSQGDDWNPVETIEKSKFRKFEQILDLLEESWNGVFGHEPEHVTPEQASCFRGMHVVFGVGMTMMSSVMGGPPEGAALTCAAGYERSGELNESRSLEGPVRKITVVKGGNAKHSHSIGENREQDAGQKYGKEECAQRGNVDQNEWQTTKPLDGAFVAIRAIEGLWRWANPL